MKRYIQEPNYGIYGDERYNDNRMIEEKDGEWIKYEEIKDYLCCTCLSVLNDKKISQGEIVKKIVREELKELEDRLLTAMTIPH